MNDQFRLTTAEQVLRMALTSLGTYMFGDAVAQGAEFQGAIGAAITLCGFVWWYFRNRTVQSNNKEHYK